LVHRYALLTAVCSLVLTTLLVGSLPVGAQEHPTVQQLFEQGIQQYANGEFVGAQQTFRRVDPLQLNKKQRLIMYETIQNIDRHIRQDTNPDKMLSEAANAQNSGKLSKALAMYQSVARHPKATQDQKRQATARLAEVKRRINVELTRARQNIDDAAADIRAGRYRAAERKLLAVQKSDLDLGWFENERVDRQLMIISERLAAQKRRATHKTPPTKPQPPSRKPIPEQETRKPPRQEPTPQEKELAQRERRLDEMQRKLVQREKAQRQRAQQKQEQQELARKEQAQQAQQEQARRDQQAQREQQQLRQQQTQQEKELAQREQRLDEMQRKLAQRERAQRQRTQQQQEQRELAHKEQAQQEQARRDQQAQREQQQLRQQQTQRETELAQREQRLDEMQRKLAEREKTQRERSQRQRAQQEQEQKELARKEQPQQAQQAQARRAQQKQREQQQLRRQQTQREKELTQQEQKLAQWEKQLAKSEAGGEAPSEEARRKQLQEKQARRKSEHRRKSQKKAQQLFQRERELAQRERRLAKQEQQIDTQERPGQLQDAPAGVGPPEAGLAPRDDTDVLTQARGLRAQEKLVKARQAKQSQQYHLAAKLYQEVLDLDPTHQEARRTLASLGSRTDLTTGPRGVLETEIQARTIRTNAAVAEFEELMNRATDLLTAQNFAAARESVQQAKITLDLNQRFLPTSRYRSLRDNAVQLAAQIADAQRITQETQKRELEIARRTEAEKRRAEALQAQQEETQHLLRRAADLRREQKYDQALELLNQALFLDPNNVASQAMKEMIEDSQIYVQARNNMRKRNLMVANQSNENTAATTPFTDLMTYPADWPQLTATRLSGLDPNTTESEINRQVALKLKDSVPINFEANKLVNIIEYLRNTTGVNFFVNWPVLEAVGVGKDLPVTLQLINVPVNQALRLVLQQASATNELEPIGFSVIEGVVTISTERDLSKITDIRPYDIRDLLVQVPNFDQAPEFDLNAALSNTNTGGSSGVGGGSGGKGSSGGLFGGGEEEGETQLTRAETIEQITNLIQDSVGKQGDWETQGGEGSIRELNGNLIIKSTPKNHRQISLLLSQLRETRAIQIAIEGRFLLVENNFLDEIGLDLDINFDDDRGGTAGKFGALDINQNSNLLAQRQRTSISPNIFFNPIVNAFDLGVSFVDDLQVDLMIRATQASRRSITLTAPRLTLFNGQRSYVVVAKQFAFISDLEPVPDGGGFDPTLSIVNSGVILDVEATVSADRRYVTMTVQPSLATLVTFPPRKIDQKASLIVGDGTVGVGLTIDAFIEAPELELTTVKTSVSVPDRGTLLIGGQRISADIEVEAGVPVLSKIPILNRLFTNTSTVKDERTLLILVKPTIIVQSEEEEMNFPGLLQNPQKYGVGQRF